MDFERNCDIKEAMSIGAKPNTIKVIRVLKTYIDQWGQKSVILTPSESEKILFNMSNGKHPSLKKGERPINEALNMKVGYYLELLIPNKGLNTSTTSWVKGKLILSSFSEKFYQIPEKIEFYEEF